MLWTHNSNLFLLKNSMDLALPDKRPFPHPIMSSIDITTSRIDTPLSNLNTHTTVGQDGTNSRVLKEMHSSNAPILKVTFNCSLNTGVAPNDWKAANIKFLFKKVDRLPTSNYCPISLTSIISKFLNIFMLQYCETPSNKWDSQSSPAWILTHLLLWDPVNFPSTWQYWHDIHIYIATYM